MSINTFKKKSVINYGSNRSANGPGGIWLPQGPFGKSTALLSISLKNPGYSGFSINGGTRNIGYVAKSSVFSKNFTPYKGEYAKGNGGCCGSYYNRDHIFSSRQVDELGTQSEYIKPSVLSTYGLLDRKYRWIKYGVYPNNIVVPNGMGNTNLSDNTSQGLYVQNKSAANNCNFDVNNEDKYKGHIVNCGPYNCSTANGNRYTYNQAAQNAPYAKHLRQPFTASQYILKIQRKCLNNSVEHLPKNKNGNVSCFVPIPNNLT